MNTKLETAQKFADRKSSDRVANKTTSNKVLVEWTI